MNHEAYPALYRAADAFSLTSQRRFYTALGWHLGLLIAAAAISVINSSEPGAAVLQALIFLGALSCAVYLFFARPDRHWYTARAVAESIKTLTWRYVACAEPFDGVSEADDALFLRTLTAVFDQNRDVAQRHTVALDGLQITEEMRRVRGLTFEERRAFYITHRISEQQDWYAKKAKFNFSTVDKFFGALVVVNFLAMAFAIARVRYPDASYWPTDIFVAIAASLLAWIQAKRFQELAASYALAAHEIGFVREQAAAVTTPNEFSKFVGDAENAFSREHTQWAARKDN